MKNNLNQQIFDLANKKRTELYKNLLIWIKLKSILTGISR